MKEHGRLTYFAYVMYLQTSLQVTVVALGADAELS